MAVAPGAREGAMMRAASAMTALSIHGRRGGVRPRDWVGMWSVSGRMTSRPPQPKLLSLLAQRVLRADSHHLPCHPVVTGSKLGQPVGAVAPVAVAQHPLVQLAGREPGKFRVEVDRTGALVMGQPLPGEGDQFVGQVGRAL